jgi:hypothetical protein
MAIELTGWSTVGLYGSTLILNGTSMLNPSTYEQDNDKPEWESPMTTEYDSLMKNKTWTLVPLPPRKNLVGCKWIYKTKFTVEG